MPVGTPGVLESIKDKGVTTAASAAFKPIPATYAPGLNKPYFKPTAKGLPIKEKPPPIKAPSAPNLNLFLNLVTAKSLPDLPSSLSCSKNKLGVSGLAAIKSVAANAPAIYPARFAI